MGRHRTEPDDAIYQERRKHYLENRDQILAKAKERWKVVGPIFSAALKQARQTVKQQRLAEPKTTEKEEL